MTSKKAIDRSGQSEKRTKIQRNQNRNRQLFLNGAACGKLDEAMATFIQAPCEKVVSGDNNSQIVFGRDRPGDRLSGYAGKGDTQAGMIDLVVGRGDTTSPKSVDENNRTLYVNPDFINDSARIYISQKTDIDENFKITDGSLGNQKTKSGIGIKADAVRIIGRDGIQLVTRTDLRNSMGVPADEDTNGIDLIAGNDDTDLQPIVKGDSLVEALNQVIIHINNLNGIVDGLLMSQMEYNQALQNHWHFSPFFGVPTSPSSIVVTEGTRTAMKQLQKTKKDLWRHKRNLKGFVRNHLKKSGKKYICSRYNNVN